MANETLYKPSEMPSAIHELGEQLNSAKYGFEKIEEAIEYSKDGTQYESDLTMAKNTILEDNELFEDIGEAIAEKDSGEIPDKSEIVERIENIPTIPTPIQNPALILWDWEGTKLTEYSREDALALTVLPSPSTLPSYARADHELLVFQGWNWSLEDIKEWIRKHTNIALDVGAIYTTIDGQNHNYWSNSRLNDVTATYIQKCGETNIATEQFKSYFSLTQINIPNNTTNINTGAFQLCYALKNINIPSSVTNIGNKAFNVCYSLSKVILPNNITNIGANAFSGCFSLLKINTPYNLTNIGAQAFSGCYSLINFYIPKKVTNISASAFNSCITLCDILNESKPTLENVNAFTNLPSNYQIYVPQENLSWFETETNWSSIYAQGHIVAIEDYIDYLESLGFNVDEYKEVES